MAHRSRVRARTAFAQGHRTLFGRRRGYPCPASVPVVGRPTGRADESSGRVRHPQARSTYRLDAGRCLARSRHWVGRGGLQRGCVHLVIVHFVIGRGGLQRGCARCGRSGRSARHGADVRRAAARHGAAAAAAAALLERGGCNAPDRGRQHAIQCDRRQLDAHRSLRRPDVQPLDAPAHGARESQSGAAGAPC
jgi:hypothetical protein